MCSRASLVHLQGSAAAATLGGPEIDNQGVALAVLPHTESRAHAQGARAVTGVQQQLTVRRWCAQELALSTSKVVLQLQH